MKIKNGTLTNKLLKKGLVDIEDIESYINAYKEREQLQFVSNSNENEGIKIFNNQDDKQIIEYNTLSKVISYAEDRFLQIAENNNIRISSRDLEGILL